jgi:hypothetical protein
MSTVEYVMGLMGVAAFATMFGAVIGSSAVREAILQMILKALT